jgi:hypothetical protein
MENVYVKSQNATVKYATTMKAAWNAKFVEFNDKNISNTRTIVVEII